MSHFAKIDSNNIVTEVIVAEQDFINSGVVGDSFLWVQTSYNAIALEKTLQRLEILGMQLKMHLYHHNHTPHGH